MVHTLALNGVRSCMKQTWFLIFSSFRSNASSPSSVLAKHHTLNMTSTHWSTKSRWEVSQISAVIGRTKSGLKCVFPPLGWFRRLSGSFSAVNDCPRDPDLTSLMILIPHEKNAACQIELLAWLTSPTLASPCLSQRLILNKKCDVPVSRTEQNCLANLFFALFE